MAPQATEIAQNGLGNGDPAALLSLSQRASDAIIGSSSIH
jgi:hypothetical protein